MMIEGACGKSCRCRGHINPGPTVWQAFPWFDGRMLCSLG